MRVADFFGLQVLATSPPYVVVQLAEDTFTILDEGLDFPYSPEEDPDEQWLNWLLEFSVSINGITEKLLQRGLAAVDHYPAHEDPA